MERHFKREAVGSYGERFVIKTYAHARKMRIFREINDGHDIWLKKSKFYNNLFTKLRVLKF